MVPFAVKTAFFELGAVGIANICLFLLGVVPAFLVNAPAWLLLYVLGRNFKFFFLHALAIVAGVRYFFTRTHTFAKGPADAFAVCLIPEFVDCARPVLFPAFQLLHRLTGALLHVLLASSSRVPVAEVSSPIELFLLLSDTSSVIFFCLAFAIPPV